MLLATPKLVINMANFLQNLAPNESPRFQGDSLLDCCALCSPSMLSLKDQRQHNRFVRRKRVDHEPMFTSALVSCAIRQEKPFVYCVLRSVSMDPRSLNSSEGPNETVQASNSSLFLFLYLHSKYR